MDHYPSLQTRPVPSPLPAHWARSPDASHTAPESDRPSYYNHQHHRQPVQKQLNHPQAEHSQPPPFGQRRHQQQQQQPHIAGSPEQQFYRPQQHPYHRQPHTSPAPPLHPPLPSSSSSSSSTSVYYPPSPPRSSNHPPNPLLLPKLRHAHVHADNGPWDQKSIADRVDIDHAPDFPGEPWRSKPASLSSSTSTPSYSRVAAAEAAAAAATQSDASSASIATAPVVVNSSSNGHFAQSRADTGPYTPSYHRHNQTSHRSSLARSDDAVRDGLDNRGEGAVATRDATGVRSGTGASASTGADLRAQHSGTQIGVGTSLGDEGAPSTPTAARTWATPPAEFPIPPEEGLAILSSVAQLHPFHASEQGHGGYQDQGQDRNRDRDQSYDLNVQDRRQGSQPSIERSETDYQHHHDRHQAQGHRAGSPTRLNKGGMSYDHRSGNNREEWSQISQQYSPHSPHGRRSSGGQQCLERVSPKGLDNNIADFRSHQQQYQQEQQHRPQYFHPRSRTPTQQRPLNEPTRDTPTDSSQKFRRISLSQPLARRNGTNLVQDSGTSTQDSSYDSSPEAESRIQGQEMEMGQHGAVPRSNNDKRFKFGTGMPNTVDFKAAIESCDALCKFALHYANQPGGTSHQQQSVQDRRMSDGHASETAQWRKEEAALEPLLDPNEFANLQMIRNMNTSMLIGLQSESKDSEQTTDPTSEHRLRFGQGPPTHEMVHELAKAATSIFQLAIRIKSWVNMTPEQRKLDEEINIIRGKRCLMMDGALSVPTLDRHGNIQKDWAIVPASSSNTKTFHERQREMEQRQSQPLIPIQSVPQQLKGKSSTNPHSTDSAIKSHRELHGDSHLFHGDNNPLGETRGLNMKPEQQEGQHRDGHTSKSGKAPKGQGKGKNKDTQSGSKSQNSKNKDEDHLKYRKRAKRTQPPGRCLSCDSSDTPEWRRGPDGARTLCNACGLHYAKLLKRQGDLGPPEYPFLPVAATSDPNTLRSSSSHMGQLQAIKFPLRRPQAAITVGESGSSASGSGSTDDSIYREGSRSESMSFASPGATAGSEMQPRSPMQAIDTSARSSVSISTQDLPPPTFQGPLSPDSEDESAFKDSSTMKPDP